MDIADLVLISKFTRINTIFVNCEEFKLKSFRTPEKKHRPVSFELRYFMFLKLSLARPLVSQHQTTKTDASQSN